MSDVAHASAAKRSQAERRDASERQLIEATMAVVATRGVDAATFDAIGLAAGYSRGLASQKFGSKRGLIDAVIGYLHRRRESILEIEHVNEMPAMDAIAHFSDRLLRELSGDYGGRAYLMLLAASVADASSMRESFAVSSNRVRDWLESVIRRGQADKTIRPDIDPRASALMIGSMVLGIGMQWLVDPTTDLEPIRKSTMAAVRQSLSLKDGQSR
ncbi:MAG: TetR/AcrR family transcriptional regulator [Bradyrhizobium sp.]|jgi:AcrR family transcriptional regulator|uniref:TetR/AcrR family transcriptional regulator n=1 Tax=Bradyrhizobium sp. TaxID=376 RepID=UPI003C7C193E